MSLGYRYETQRIPFRDPFRIARELDSKADEAGREAVTVMFALWDSDDGMNGPVGLGEGFPDTYYGETPETMGAALPLLVRTVEPFVAQIKPGTAAADACRILDEAEAAMELALRRNGAAKCAVDTALYDLVGQRLGLSAFELAGLAPEMPPTDFSIGIDEPSIVADRARRATESVPFVALKIKVGSAADLDTLEGVRAVYPGPLRVDANTGWKLDDAVALLPVLERLGVELIEQPFPAHRLDQLRALQEQSSIPIVADESAVTIDDLEPLRGVVAGVNVKLAKCGGIGPARRMLSRARELGFRTFLGCMEETSVGIASSVVVASLAEWIDLDGCLLLSSDPFDGLTLGPDARWQLPRLDSRHGLGVARTPAPYRPLLDPLPR